MLKIESLGHRPWPGSTDSTGRQAVSYIHVQPDRQKTGTPPFEERTCVSNTLVSLVLICEHKNRVAFTVC